jgi:excisionase family DNA binding protein
MDQISEIATKQVGGQNRLLTVPEVAKILKVTRAMVYGWIFRRQLAHMKLGRFVRIDPQDLQAFLKFRKRAAFFD